MEAHNAPASRTRFLSRISFPVLGLFVLGLVFISIDDAQFYIPGRPDTPVGEFFWTGGLLLIGGGIIGGIVVIAIAIVIATRTARANANLRRLCEQLISAREEERRRLRRDLHDGLGPLLASLRRVFSD